MLHLLLLVLQSRQLPLRRRHVPFGLIGFCMDGLSGLPCGFCFFPCRRHLCRRLCLNTLFLFYRSLFGRLDAFIGTVYLPFGTLNPSCRRFFKGSRLFQFGHRLVAVLCRTVQHGQRDTTLPQESLQVGMERLQVRPGKHLFGGYLETALFPVLCHRDKGKVHMRRFFVHMDIGRHDIFTPIPLFQKVIACPEKSLRQFLLPFRF